MLWDSEWQAGRGFDLWAVVAEGSGNERQLLRIETAGPELRLAGQLRLGKDWLIQASGVRDGETEAQADSQHPCCSAGEHQRGSRGSWWRHRSPETQRGFASQLWLEKGVRLQDTGRSLVPSTGLPRRSCLSLPVLSSPGAGSPPRHQSFPSLLVVAKPALAPWRLGTSLSS